MTDTSKKILKSTVRIVGTAALLAWVFSKIDLSQITTNATAICWRYVFFAWALMLVICWLRSVKMKLILDEQDCPLNTAKVFAASAITALYNLVMPGLVSSAVKWYIIRSHTGKGHKVLSSMIYNQVSDAVTFSAVGLVALMITNPGGQTYLPVICGLLLAAVVIGSVLLLSHRFGTKVTELLRYSLKPFPALIRDKGGEVLEQISLFQTVEWGFHLKMLVLNLIRMAFRAWLYLLAAEAAQVEVGFTTVVWVTALLFLLGRLPISVGNLGVREATLVQSLGMYGVEGSKAVLVSMIVFSCIVFMACIGGLLQLFGSLGTKKSGYRRDSTA